MKSSNLVLVTGGAGFIGSHTVDLLLSKGYDVRILDNLSQPVHENHEWPSYIDKKAEKLFGDVTCKHCWELALRNVDYVIHLAAYQDAHLDFSKYFKTNSVGTSLMYEVIVENKLPIKKIVVASSQSVYGEGMYKCNCGLGINIPPLRDELELKSGKWDVTCPVCHSVLELIPTDESIVSPHNQYAVSKYSQELIAFNLGKRYNIPSSCMRYSIVQGPRQSPRNAYSGILRTFTQRLMNGKQPVCYEDGKQLRDYVSVYDVAKANVLVMETPISDFHAFNVGGGHNISVVDYAKLISKKLGLSIEPLIPGLYRFGDTRHILSDTSKLGLLKWKASVSFDGIVDSYIEWAKSQKLFLDYYEDIENKMIKTGMLRKINNENRRK